MPRNAGRLSLLLAAAMLASCSAVVLHPPLVEAPRISLNSPSARQLTKLPAPASSTVVSVYDFQDQTGQLKPGDQYADYSRAITQGGLAILNKALLQAGDGSWFTVVERGGLKNLLQERQIIRLTRSQYPPLDGKPVGLPPMLYAGLLIEGGVIGYDSNIVTGGAGANYLGIGGDVKYRRDIVTVDLRAVSIASGQILLSVTAEKTIYSMAVNGNIFKVVSLDHLLQAETGYTVNEPPQLAVRQAIEAAVYSLVMEGVRKQFWSFADAAAGRAALVDYARYTGDRDDGSADSPPFLPTGIAQATSSFSEDAAPTPLNGHEKSPESSLIEAIGGQLPLGDDGSAEGVTKQTLPDHPPIPLKPGTSR